MVCVGLSAWNARPRKALQRNLKLLDARPSGLWLGLTSGKIGGEEPGVAERVLDRCGAVTVGRIAWRIHCRGAGGEGVRVNSIDVGHLNVEIGLLGLPRRFVDFEGGTGKFDGGMANYAVG